MNPKLVGFGGRNGFLPPGNPSGKVGWAKSSTFPDGFPGGRRLFRLQQSTFFCFFYISAPFGTAPFYGCPGQDGVFRVFRQTLQHLQQLHLAASSSGSSAGQVGPLLCTMHLGRPWEDKKINPDPDCSADFRLSGAHGGPRNSRERGRFENSPGRIRGQFVVTL